MKLAQHSSTVSVTSRRSWTSYTHARCGESAASRRCSLSLSSRSSSTCGWLAAGGRQRSTSVCRTSYDDQLTIADLKQQLNEALKVEDYMLAARIRDELQRKQFDGKLAVEEANRRFYDAFASGDMKEMETIWGQGDHVQVLHPANDCIAGREAVMESWKKVLKNVRPRAFNIILEDVRIYATETFGYVTCVEVIDADDSKGRIAATNVFEKQEGKWVITHHHGAPTRLAF